MGENKKIGVLGTSFGGATAGIYLGSDHGNKNIDFAILDCPVSDMEYMITTEMEEMDIGIPMTYLIFTGNMVNKIKLGFSYKDANVASHIKNTSVPVLVINTEIDQVTPYFMGEDIYKAIPHNKKKIFTVTDSKHAEINVDYPNEFEENIMEFIKTYK